MANSLRPLEHMDRANEIGSRATSLMDLTTRALMENTHRNAHKAHLYVHHAIGHIHDAYGHQCVSDSDRDHFLGLAEFCLNHAADLLKEE